MVSRLKSRKQKRRQNRIRRARLPVPVKPRLFHTRLRGREYNAMQLFRDRHEIQHTLRVFLLIHVEKEQLREDVFNEFMTFSKFEQESPEEALEILERWIYDEEAQGREIFVAALQLYWAPIVRLWWDQLCTFVLLHDTKTNVPE